MVVCRLCEDDGQGVKLALGLGSRALVFFGASMPCPPVLFKLGSFGVQCPSSLAGHGWFGQGTNEPRTNEPLHGVFSRWHLVAGRLATSVGK